MAGEDVQAMADEVATLMAQRLGGARRGKRVDLAMMVRRRGGALPRRQRRAANVLMKAAARAGQPRVAQQTDNRRAARAHAELMSYLRPLGMRMRWQASAINIGAAVMMGLLMVGAVALWLMVRRGML